MASVPLSRLPIGRRAVSPSYLCVFGDAFLMMDGTRPFSQEPACKDSPAGPKKNETWEFVFLYRRLSEGGLAMSLDFDARPCA